MPAEQAIWSFLTELVILLSAALLLGAIMERFKQSAIVGYLLAGTIIGPNVFGLIDADGAMNAAAELGVSLLLFAIGLEFSVKRLLAIGPIGLGGGSLQVISTMAVVTAVAWPLLGLEPGIAVGAVVALSSTACVLRVLRDRAEVDSVHGRNALGILLLQDIAVVPLVLLVTMLAGSGSIGEMAFGMAKAFGLIIAMVAGFYLLSRLVVAKAMGTETLIKSRELSLLVAVVLAFGSAGAAHSLKLSPALGAFLAGMMLAESPFAVKVRADVGALRTLFVTLFFASVGMLGDPGWIIQNWLTVGVAVVVIVLAKGLIITAVSLIFGYGLRQAIATGICLAQVGEFSFVLAGVAHHPAQGNPVISDETFKLIVSATLVTLILTPYLVMFAPKTGEWVAHRLGRHRKPRTESTKRDAHDESNTDHHPPRTLLLIGYGPAGQRVAERAKRLGIHVSVLDLHPRNVQLAIAAGYEAHLGDATHGEVLEHTHLSHLVAAVIAIPDQQAAMSITQQLREASPNLPIVARARFSKFTSQIQRSGATTVVDEEVETGRRLAVELARAISNNEPEQS